MEKSIGDYVKESLSIFGREVNTKRQLPSVMDGLKPSYRHILIEELKTGPQMRKTADIIGSTLSTTHPHGDQSLVDPVSNLVRWGISKGQGNHGKKMIVGDDTSPAAMRYTEARISDKYYNIFSELLPYVPTTESEVKGTEPEYLPTIIPLCLIFGSMGLGLGVNCRIPAFTPGSIMEAYFNDDPNLLEGNFGMIIDKTSSELQSLWDKGVGKVCYKYEVYPDQIEGRHGYVVKGSPEIFKPALTRINQLVEQGKVYILDMTNGTCTQIFIAKEYNVKSISNSELEEIVRSATTNTKSYRLTVADGDSCYLIPMKEWIRKTVENYMRLIEVMKSDKIQKLQTNYKIYENLPKVAQCLMDNRDYSNEQISEKTKVELPIVQAILSKSINALRRTDTDNKLKSIDDSIKFYQSIIPIEKVKLMTNELKDSI